MKSEQGKKIHALISSFNDQEKNKIDEIVYDAIEEVVFNCLFMFESSDNFSIALKEETDPAHDLGQISDRLAGELFSDDGWIKKYSQFPSQE